jgi:hypothetical protein
VNLVGTTGIDSLTGTTADDSFVFDSGTVSAADAANGGDGTDTVKVYGALTIPAITGIENLEVHHGTAGDFNIDTGDLSSVTTLTLDGLTINDKTVTLGNDETLVIRDATGANKDINLTGNATTLLTANVVLENSGDSTNAIDIDVLGTLLDTVNVTSQGALAMNYLSINTSGTPTITTANITATGKGLTVEDVADATTVNASTSTAPITLSTAVTSVTYTGGSGVDTITLAQTDAAHTFKVNLGDGNDKVSITNIDAVAGFTDNKSSLVGGDGTDTLSGEEELIQLLGAMTTTAFAKKGISGFEKIELDDTGADGVTYTLSNFGVNHLILTADDADNNTVAGITSGFTLQTGKAVDDLGGTGSTDDYTFTLTDRAGAGDVVNFDIDNTAGTGDFEFAGGEIEVVNIDASGSDQANTVGLNMAQLETITVKTGTTDVTIDLSSTGDAGLNVNTVDASGSVSTGGLVFTADASNLAGITFTGSSGGDNFTGGDLSDVVVVGSGDDIIDVAAGGANTVDLSAGGADQVEINSLTGFVTVTGFGSTDDIDIQNAEIHTATVSYTSANTGLIDLTNEYVLINGLNASTTALKSGGSQTIADFTDLTDVAAYLEEALDILEAEDVGIVLNDGTDSYIYHVDVDGDTTVNNRVDAGDLTLLAKVEDYILDSSTVVVTP